MSGKQPGQAVDIEGELGRYDDFTLEWLKSIADEFLVREWAVHFSRVEEGYIPIYRRMEVPVISYLSFGGPYEKVMPIQPRPRAETSRPLFSSGRSASLTLASRGPIRNTITRHNAWPLRSFDCPATARL